MEWATYTHSGNNNPSPGAHDPRAPRVYAHTLHMATPSSAAARCTGPSQPAGRGAHRNT